MHGASLEVMLSLLLLYATMLILLDRVTYFMNHFYSGCSWCLTQIHLIRCQYSSCPVLQRVALRRQELPSLQGYAPLPSQTLPPSLPGLPTVNN